MCLETSVLKESSDLRNAYSRSNSISPMFAILTIICPPTPSRGQQSDLLTNKQRNSRRLHRQRVPAAALPCLAGQTPLEIRLPKTASRGFHFALSCSRDFKCGPKLPGRVDPGCPF